MNDKCPWHKTDNLGYLQWFADAEKRQKKGQQQKQCPDCGYWFWPDMFGKKPKTLRQHINR